jgi:hypothetical protein
MAKPYRRRKGKNGAYVGNFRVAVDGRDINLGTKDATEAHARARLAVKGKWPPIPAAVESITQSLDPGAPPPEQVPEPSPPAGATTDEGGGPLHAVPPVTHGPPPPEAPSHDPSQPLNEAIADAATQVSGIGSSPEKQAAQENDVDAEMRAVLEELNGGATGAELIDFLCDAGAGILLWAETKGIQLGVNTVLARRKADWRLRTKELEEKHVMRRVLRVGLKASAVKYFPDIASNLSPGWAIAIGLVGGGVTTVVGGSIVDARTGARRESVGDMIVKAQEEAAAAASAATNGASSAPIETSPPPA